MAAFVGNREEFRRYIGPRLRNLVNLTTRKSKGEAGGCQECGARGELHAAHVHGRDRNQIIDLVLDAYPGNNDVVTIDLEVFETKFIEEHHPLNESFRFLCQRCHTEYDRLVKTASRERLAESVASSPIPPHEPRARVESERSMANKTYTSNHLNGMPAEERRLVLTRVREWASKPHLNVHRIVGIIVRRGDMSRYQLVAETERVTGSRNAYGAIASLLTSAGNNYGRVFEDVNGTIRLHPAVAQEVLSFRWS